MPERLPIFKLAEVEKPQISRFRSTLLASRESQELDYLRQMYTDIQTDWENPTDDKTLFNETEPKMRELFLTLEEATKRGTDRSDVYRMVMNAQQDFATAMKQGGFGNYAVATSYLSYAMMKLQGVIDILSTASLNRHVAYGYDISGEVMEPGEQESRSPNLWDQGNSPKLDRTPTNPANSMVDPEAENDFPELKETKHKRVDWPARTR